MKEFGKYLIFLASLVVRRESFKTYYKLTLDEAILVGVNSILLVALVSSFMGAVTTVQTAYNMVSPLIPSTHHYRHYICRQSRQQYGRRPGHHAHHRTN